MCMWFCLLFVGKDFVVCLFGFYRQSLVYLAALGSVTRPYEKFVFDSGISLCY